MTYRQPSHPQDRRIARQVAYQMLPASERAVIDAVAARIEERIPRSGPLTSFEIVAAIGELLAAMRARE